MPQRNALSVGFSVHVGHAGEVHGWFARREATIAHEALPADDCGVRDGDRWLAMVERKSIEDFIGSLSNDCLAFQLGALAELPLAALVVQGRYPKLLEAPRVKPDESASDPSFHVAPSMRTKYNASVHAPTRSLEELRAMVGALDPDCLAAESDVDRTLIAIALERSPLERVRFAQQMLETLLRFRRVQPTGL